MEVEQVQIGIVCARDQSRLIRGDGIAKGLTTVFLGPCGRGYGAAPLQIAEVLDPLARP